MVQISLQNSGGKVVFLGGFHGTPSLGHQRKRKYLGHLSVKDLDKLLRKPAEVPKEKTSNICAKSAIFYPIQPRSCAFRNLTYFIKLNS